MVAGQCDNVERVQRLVNGLPRHDGSFVRADVPLNGIYFFFEKGETVMFGGEQLDRIVRVGTHRGSDRLGKRLRLHYRGKTRTSAFRRHLGATLIDLGAFDQIAVDQFARQSRTSIPELEVEISRLIHERFCFACIEVNEMEERLRLEAGLIGLLANPATSASSAKWLGRRADRADIRASGLWNVQHVSSPALSASDVELVGRLCSTS